MKASAEYRVLVSGDRGWTNHWAIQRDLGDIFRFIDLVYGDAHKRMVVIHGAQGKLMKEPTLDRVSGKIVRLYRGADMIANEIALGLGDAKQGCRVDPHPADWGSYGRAAGPRRNQEMVDLEPHVVLIYHKDLRHSKGSKDLARRAYGAGLHVRVREY